MPGSRPGGKVDQPQARGERLEATPLGQLGPDVGSPALRRMGSAPDPAAGASRKVTAPCRPRLKWRPLGGERLNHRQTTGRPHAETQHAPQSAATSPRDPPSPTDVDSGVRPASCTSRWREVRPCAPASHLGSQTTAL